MTSQDRFGYPLRIMILINLNLSVVCERAFLEQNESCPGFSLMYFADFSVGSTPIILHFFNLMISLSKEMSSPTPAEITVEPSGIRSQTYTILHTEFLLTQTLPFNSPIIISCILSSGKILLVCFDTIFRHLAQFFFFRNIFFYI